MKKLILIIICALFTNSIFAKNIIKGVIKDSMTKEYLAHTNIYIENTYIGTVSNDVGTYSLELPKLPATLIISYIGYKTQKIEISQKGKITLDIKLMPLLLESESIVVTASREDPAIGIMRKVIANKIIWKKKLHSFKAKAYTRMRVENEKAIVSMSEAVSEIYWNLAKGAREKFFAKETSKSLPYLTDMQVGSKDIINLYDDDVSFFNHKFVGPTHPDALNYYDFELSGERQKDSIKVYDIKVIPKSKLQPLFFGNISILDKHYAMIDANLTTSESITFSEMIKSIKAKYHQQFTNFGKDFWLLIDSRAKQEVEIDMGVLAFPKAVFNKVSRISNYEINIDVTDEINKIDTTTVASKILPSSLKDQKIFSNFEGVPLTKKEEQVYSNPDTSLTLINSFRPTGPLASFMISREDELEKSLRNKGGYTPIDNTGGLGFEARYNRVEEFNIGINYIYPLTKNFRVSLAAGYLTGLKDFYYKSQLKYLFNAKEPSTFLYTGYSDETEARYESDNYSQLFTSILPLFGNDDYFDYYTNRKLNFGLNYGFGSKRSLIKAGFNFEDHSSVNKTSNCNTFDKSFKQRNNPAINEGNLNSVEIKYIYSELNDIPEFARHFIDISSFNKFEISIEHSSSDYLNSSFDFTRYNFELSYTLKTFFKRRPDYNYLRTKILSSTFSGDLPLQKFTIIDGSIYSYAPFGIFKTLRDKPLEGEKRLALFWEYNFKSIPFELLGLKYFAKNKYEFLIHGASGRTWIGKERLQELNKFYQPFYSDNTHNEVGASLKFKYKFITVIMDATHNLNSDRTYLGFSLNLIGMSF